MKPLALGRNPRGTLTRAAALIASAIVVFGFILLPVRSHGISMLPTYTDGTLNFANRAAYWWREPARGDVVAIRMAGWNVVYVKRIVAVPGERIEIVAGVVLINRKPLIEPHVRDKAPWNMSPETLSSDEYFVIGDNRAMPMSEHDFGRTSRSRIIGKMIF
jgi:signal peptidase I